MESVSLRSISMLAWGLAFLNCRNHGEAVASVLAEELSRPGHPNSFCAQHGVGRHAVKGLATYDFTKSKEIQSDIQTRATSQPSDLTLSKGLAGLVSNAFRCFPLIPLGRVAPRFWKVPHSSSIGVKKPVKLT